MSLAHERGTVSLVDSRGAVLARSSRVAPESASFLAPGETLRREFPE